jgi:NAD(P)-dependent dehydrogenase (short-subunit alcohol dehydrogenase family)
LAGEIQVLKLDVTEEADIVRAVKYITDHHGQLDVLINNAGIISTGTGATSSEAREVKRVMETNFYGAWRVAQLMLPLLEKSREARIINMSSGMGALDDLDGGYAAYRMSKSALNALTILLANELRGKISVNAMCPGWVRTEMGGADASRSIEQGADTAVWLATAEKIPTGKFFRDRKVISW